MDVVAMDQFWAALEKSNLLTAEQLAQARQIAANEADSQAVARTLARQGLLTRWQAGQLLAGRPSFFLGKYKLIEHLGRGGMGSVFLAHHVTMNRRVALKTLSKGLDRNPAAMERFLSEARAIAALDHPNIVQAYSVDNDEDRFFLVMEFVDGRDLGRIVEEDGPLGYDAAADVIRQAAEGLAHAHGKGMIHCDIKPSNLLVNNQGVVKILDLGVARLTGPKRAEADEKENVVGTVDYMAPEQAMGGAFDHRVDIYSLGCTLYFLLTGHAPFPEGTLHQRILKHQTDQPANILERRPDAPKDLVRIVRKMMAKDPAERFQTAAEVAQALSQFNPDQLKRAVPLEDAPAALDPLADLGLDTPPRGAGASGAHRALHKTRKAAPRRNQTMLIAGGAFVVALLAMIAGVIAVVATGKKAERSSEAPSSVSTQPEQEPPAPKSFNMEMPKFDVPPPNAGGFQEDKAISAEELQKRNQAAAAKPAPKTAPAKPPDKPAAKTEKTPPPAPKAKQGASP